MKGNDFKNRCVFFCGPHALKKALMSKCDKFNIGFRAETF
jgi:predicted ferric reductase|tara:strand:- start:4646 stop:4765 length:120 start_codon:yes stop_codon:yes gene_type:complete